MVATGTAESMIVAKRLVDLLGQAGAEVVFGIGGTHGLQLLGAFERRGTVRFVSARNEQGAAYMAVRRDIRDEKVSLQAARQYYLPDIGSDAESAAPNAEQSAATMRNQRSPDE
jgi:hypothetical protein